MQGPLGVITLSPDQGSNTITRCTFNGALETGPSAIYFPSGGDLGATVISDSSFNTISSYSYGTIYVDAAGTTLEILRCNFTSSNFIRLYFLGAAIYPDFVGVILLNEAFIQTVMVNDCRFTDIGKRYIYVI